MRRPKSSHRSSSSPQALRGIPMCSANGVPVEIVSTPGDPSYPPPPFGADRPVRERIARPAARIGRERAMNSTDTIIIGGGQAGLAMTDA